MINLYSMQFGLLATLGSIGIQAAMFLTMMIYVRPAKDACPIDTELNDEIYSNQRTIWWCYSIFHLVCAIFMALRELNNNSNLNTIYEIVMLIFNMGQIGLLCQTMQAIFVDQSFIYISCLDGQQTPEMPLQY
jgi:hypothetical protein